MDFDDAKENIQPLAQGRNASILHASLRAESPQELLARRKELEKEIHNYTGDDPLSVWYNYIEWIEQSFPSGGKESGLQEVLSKCLVHFENDDRYKQDRRMIKLYIKFIDSHKDPAECYQQLFSAGIGTMVADFYIAWAYCYDLTGNTRKADEIFLRGIACRAQPLEELQEARQHFGFSVAQRIIYKDDDPIKQETNRQLNERRMALTSLRGYRRKQIIGSIRTGSAVKSISPGKVKIDLPSSSSQRGNMSKRVDVFKDENDKPNITSSIDSNLLNEVGKSVVRSIVDSARNQENQKEPGPWNNAHNHKKGKLFGKPTNTELGFEIHEDVHDDNSENIKKPCFPPIEISSSEIKYDKPFIYLENFCAHSKPIRGWLTPVTTEEMPDKNTIPGYNKCKLYPRPNMEFQPEELKAYNILKKRDIQNDFTKERDEYWGCGPEYNVRLYPHFATHSKPQNIDLMDQFFIPNKVAGLKVAFDEIYNKKDEIERQFEEILALRVKRNDTIIKTTDMEETMCVTSEKIRSRKSFFPMRKSLAAPNFKIINKIADMQNLSGEDKILTMNELPTSTDSESGKLAVDEVKAINSPQCKTPQILEKDASCSKEIPFASVHTISAAISPKKSNVFEKVVTHAASLETFEIYKDDSAEEFKIVKSPKSTATNSNDFQFITPAVPITTSTSAAGASNKLPFEIFNDENLVPKSPTAMQKPDFSCGTGGFFDPEETCSTQTFNIFLKAQSVSTPKAVTKLQPPKQFGNILKEVTSPLLSEQKDDHHITPIAESLNNATGATTSVTYSPPRQQLSTILETSEHGTTQGTHTTGATTKSTISSPEFDTESQVQTTTNTVVTNHPQIILETVKELSCETSVDEMMNSLKIQNATDINAQTLAKNIQTPGTMRLQSKCTGGLNFLVFEDSFKNDAKQVGNFSRLEEKEDTATSPIFKALPLIRFQDDKTETISKMLNGTEQVKFQDDKTETISKMILEPIATTQSQEDKTETVSKMLLAPPHPIKFSEEDTESILKFMLAPPKPVKFEDDKAELILTSNQQINVHQDDSFEFFGQTPPKSAKQLITKQIGRGSLSHVRTAVDCRTPLTFNSKRFCENDTPEIQKAKPLSKPTVLFEDELQCNMKDKQTYKLKNNLNDSTLPEFSLFEKSQPALIQNPKSKSVFRDSFIPDFSVIEDSQPQTEQLQFKKQNKQEKNEAMMPELSYNKNIQPPSRIPTQANTSKLSISDFFLAPATQSDESIIKSSQPTEYRHLKHSLKDSSANKNVSKTNIKKNKTDDIITWQQTPNLGIASHLTQEGTNLKNILMDTFMKDFSEINGPPSMPKDMGEIKLDRPSKSNSSLRFLNESLLQKPVRSRNNENNFKLANVSSSKEANINFLAIEPSADKSSSKEKTSSTNNDDKYFEFNCETEMFGTNISMIKNSTWLPNHNKGSITDNAKKVSQIHEKSLHIKQEDVSSNSFLITCSNSKNDQDILNCEELIKAKQNSIEKSLCNNDFSIEISTTELAAVNAETFRNRSGKPNAIQDSPEQIDDDCENSIYYKQTPKTPKPQVHIWDDANECKTPSQNHYVHTESNLNQTHQVIESFCIDPNVNPFNVDLINAFLEQHYVVSYLESLPTCKLVGNIQRIKPNAAININGVNFNVIKLIGEGAYGAIFCGKETNTGKLVAMKQERPPNLWEYYICLEIQERIRIDEMLLAYMSVDYALIGNNSSILISNFSKYGSLITVCNKIKKHTMKNVDEYVVMLLASELLEVMDHLHAVNIIHADVKADNFLLMNKLTYPPTERHLQLIDFGVSIDMKLFKQGQTFSFVHNDNSFKCPEMREGRPWNYQLDLYGLAGVFHVLLFGKYMEIEKARGFWIHKTHVPRYINKHLWDQIFKTLLNVRDCNSMPNLQDLRALLKKEMEEKDKYMLKMVNEFNRALSN